MTISFIFRIETEFNLDMEEKIIETILHTNNGKIINGDNLDVLGLLETNSVDSCISDFPYDLSFMGKKWDSTGNFYEWNKERAVKLFRVVKPGGCVAIFGHPKTNHRMKCAFEDSGFKIVEEIDWIYLTGMPKNQDIGKLFDKAAGAERKVVGIDKSKLRPNRKCENDGAERVLAGGFKSDNGATITEPACELAKKWNGWKTSGLKPAHEPITIFQKPLEGTYIQNIEKYDCGGMNIDACRIPISKEDIDMLNAKASKTPTTNYSDRDDRIYGKYAEDKAMPCNELGRFPSNIVVDEYVAELLDDEIEDGSKYFTVIKYEPKISPSERKLPNGERNPHVTPKPVALIKWLIKLLTPINGMTIDITAGSCTHAVACEELNKNDSYGLKYINIELMNTEEEPYCSVGEMRVKAV
jgi:site-specific DNA-methyltransferase (adenine-specific)